MSDPPMDFGRLPVDIKLLIFSYFPTDELSKRLAPVCREWWKLCKHRSLWKKLKLRISPEKSVEVYSQIVLHCRNSLTSLKVLAVGPFNAFISILTNAKLCALKDLDLRGHENLDESDMLTIVSNCPDIEILNLALYPNNIALKCIQHVVTLHKLKSLSASLDDDEAKECLELIAKQCTRLEVWNIRVSPGIIDDEFAIFLAENRKETLKHLFLSGANLNAAGLTALASCQNMSTLHLNIFCNTYSVTTENLKLISEMQKLKWLFVNETMSVESQAWVKFFKCPNLSSLRIIELDWSHIDDTGLENLALTCRQVVILSLVYCDNVHGNGVRAVIDNCSELFYFNISGVLGVTGDMLNDIPEKLPKLRCLDLSECHSIREKDIEGFARNCPRIKVLHRTAGSAWTPTRVACSDENIKHLYFAYTLDHRLKVKWIRDFSGQEVYNR